ncbi:MAG: EamA family transporter [Oscillospiraceae bacterium]
MWLAFAFGSAFFAGITAILAKIGIKNTDSTLATALRTVVVLVFSWLMVFIVGSQNTIADVSGKTLLFLVLSGLATGGSWLFYFRALQLGDVNKVTPIDKSSTVLTMLLAFILLGEQITLLKLVGMVGIGVGTVLMVLKSRTDSEPSSEKAPDHRWVIYAALSAVFASLTSILGKIGIEGIDSTLGTAIRTAVVLVMAWFLVLITGKQRGIRAIDRRSWIFIALSGVATGASWLCYYRALHDGPANIVVPVDKLSILLTVAFSYIFLKEKLSAKAAIGLAVTVAGTLVLLI